MSDQDQKETMKREVGERLIPINEDLVKLGKDFSADIFLVVNAPHLGFYGQSSQIQRLATLDRIVNELNVLREATLISRDVDVRLSEDESK